MAEWRFYGRTEQLAELERELNRKRWFLAKVTGRRRIGKTSLIQRAMRRSGNRQPVFYVQIPDSEPAGILSARQARRSNRLYRLNHRHLQLIAITGLLQRHCR